LVEVVDLPARDERIETTQMNARELSTNAASAPAAMKWAAASAPAEWPRIAYGCLINPPEMMAPDVSRVVFGVVHRWRHVIAVAEPTQIYQDAPILRQLFGDRSPDPAVAAVAVQAEQRQG
jgi:hypothetical protein